MTLINYCYVIMLCYAMLYLVFLQWSLCSTNYGKSYNCDIAIVIMAEGRYVWKGLFKVALAQLLIVQAENHNNAKRVPSNEGADFFLLCT